MSSGTRGTSGRPTIPWVRYLKDGTEETVLFPAKMVVCYTCEGKGTTVNPSIDGNGLTREDFDEDPDFAESYLRGDYDVQCRTCKGKNVVAVMDRPRCNRAQLKVYDKEQDDDAREWESERWLRMAESGERY